MMRPIDTIVIHCSDTFARMDTSARDIDQWHRARGFAGIGYHYVIRRNGNREIGRPVERVGAHVRGYNARSIGICMVGGKGDDGSPECNFTRSQWSELDWLVGELIARFPGAKVIGHRDLDPGKACPCFDVTSWHNV